VTYHSPPHESAAAAEQCFVPTRTFDEPLLFNPNPFHSRVDSVFWDDCYVADLRLLILRANATVMADIIHDCLQVERPRGSTERAFWLVGDSHAGSIMPGVQRAVAGHMTFRWFAMSFGGLLYCGMTPKECRVANRVQETILQVFARLARPGDVVAVSHAGYKSGDQYAYLDETVWHGTIKPTGAKLVIFGDPAGCAGWATNCIPSSFRPNVLRQCDKPNDEEYGDGNLLFQPIAEANPGEVYYFEMHDLFCTANPGGICGATVPGSTTFAYFDDSHLTRAGGLYLWPYLCAFFDDAGFFEAAPTTFSSSSSSGSVATLPFASSAAALSSVPIAAATPAAAAPPPPSACSCSPNLGTHTFHQPPEASSSSAVPCFNDTTPPYDTGPDTIGVHNNPDPYYEMGCYTDPNWLPNVTDVEERIRLCITPTRSPASQRVLWLLGDSHAGSLQPGVRRSVQGTMAYRWMTVINCGLLDCSAGAGWDCAKNANCRAATQTMLAVLREHATAGDVVVVSHAGYKVGAEHVPFFRNVVVPILSAAGASLVIMGDPPMTKNSISYCTPSVFKPDAFKGCETAFAPEANWDQNQEFKVLTTETDNVFYFDIYEHFCTDAVCGIVVPGTTTFAYIDNSHLTTMGGLYLWPYFCAFFRARGFF